MSTQLFIQIDEKTSLVSWCLCDTKTAKWESGENDIIDVMEMARKHPVILIIPAQLCTIHHIDLPPGNRTALLKAIPFALEEKLIEDPKTYHFAVGNLNVAQPVLIVTLNKNTLTALLQPWKENSANIVAVVPELLTFPHTPSEWYIFIKQGLAKSTLSGEEGFCCDISQLSFFLRQEMANPQHTMPKKIKFHLYDDESIFPEKEIADLPLATEIIYPDTLPIVYQAKNILTHLPINLLQSKFKHEFKIRHKLNSKIYCPLIAMLTIFLLIGNFTLESWRLYQQKQNNNLQIKNIYQSIFPDSTSMTSPKIRIERKLAETNQVDTHDLFLRLMHKTVMVMQNQYDIRFEKFTFENKKLTITFAANSPDNYDKFVKSLSAEKLDVLEHSLSKQSAKIFATITIKEKTS